MNSAKNKKIAITLAVLVCTVAIGTSQMHTALGYIWTSGFLEVHNIVNGNPYAEFEWELWTEENYYIVADGTLFTYYVVGAELYRATVVVQERVWPFWNWGTSDDWNFLNGQWDLTTTWGPQELPYDLHLTDKKPNELIDYRIVIQVYYSSVWGPYYTDTIEIYRTL